MLHCPECTGSSITLAHNRPRSNLKPSEQDLNITKSWLKSASYWTCRYLII
ncbi:hypothetical protein DCO56_18465 [Sphingobacterium athyrii]|uniref:RadC-like JAB domain-containing protein n=1 Tax=Sphingobacterium athyrii TaxID=2152717 RepID=A0A363NQU2_9SPHI|nr:hypothetical protein DCO56_18465 [Sphingobacterium athyrii]